MMLVGCCMLSQHLEAIVHLVFGVFVFRFSLHVSHQDVRWLFACSPTLGSAFIVQVSGLCPSTALFHELCHCVVQNVCVYVCLRSLFDGFEICVPKFMHDWSNSMVRHFFHKSMFRVCFLHMRSRLSRFSMTHVC